MATSRLLTDRRRRCAMQARSHTPTPRSISAPSPTFAPTAPATRWRWSGCAKRSHCSARTLGRDAALDPGTEPHPAGRVPAFVRVEKHRHRHPARGGKNRTPPVQVTPSRSRESSCGRIGQGAEPLHSVGQRFGQRLATGGRSWLSQAAFVQAGLPSSVVVFFQPSASRIGSRKSHCSSVFSDSFFAAFIQNWFAFKS